MNDKARSHESEMTFDEPQIDWLIAEQVFKASVAVRGSQKTSTRWRGRHV